jgi:CubicO group peptidase (beta-lactamase class C family)
VPWWRPGREHEAAGRWRSGWRGPDRRDLGAYAAGGLPLQLPAGIADDERMIRYVPQWRPDAAPCTQRRYSNRSIGLLGHITGLALGGGFAEAVETQLLPRLGLRHSDIRLPDRAMVDEAWGYDSATAPDVAARSLARRACGSRAAHGTVA